MKTFLFFSILLSVRVVFGQVEPIATDRPDQTECPFIVPVNNFQVETGFVFEHEKSKQIKVDAYVHPSTLFKYGILDKRLELRLIVETNTIQHSESNETKKISGLSPLQFGFKVNLLQERGLIPKTSLIFHVAPPNWSSSEFKTKYIAPNFRFTMQHTLSEKYTLAYNLGAEWDGFNSKPIAIYTLTVGHPLGEKVGSYVELYGFLPPNGKPDHRFDGGFTYLILPNFQLDASAGIGITECAPNMFVGFGASFRLPK